MKRITTETKFYLKCDKCKTVFTEEVPHIVINAKSYCGLEEWDHDHYNHMDSELSFCHPCGSDLYSKFLRIINSGL